MQVLAALLLAVGAVLLSATPARASCIQQTRVDQLARADVVVYGRVTSVDRGAGTMSFRALTVYKGDPGSRPLMVHFGPAGGGATSVDYRAEPGDHLLYLQRQGSEYVTNDCSGSHPGPVTAEELRVLPAGTVVTQTDAGPDPLDGRLALAAAALVAAAVAVFVTRRRGKTGSPLGGTGKAGE